MIYLDNTYILGKILLIPGILLGFTFHEYAHAIVADKLGDKTPRFQGRLTLNPIAHIDIIGFIMIIVANFGWAKPVETNPSAFKRYYKDDLKVSIAGPIANLILALIMGIILAVFLKISDAVNMNPSLFRIISMIIMLAININCVLFVLNLIPIPGFDGFHILRDLFPKFFYKISGEIYRYQFVIMIVFILLLGNIVVARPAAMLGNLIYRVSDLIYGWKI